MKRLYLILAAAFACMGASAQEPVVLKVKVGAVQERYFAGPYAKYAAKYLGVDAEQNSSASTVLTAVSVSVEPAASQSLAYTPGEPLEKKADFTSAPLLKESIGQRSIELAASLAAEQILQLRQKRYQILTGDTDLSLSGESLKLTLEEFAREESELLKLFFGYTVKKTLESEFAVLPQQGETSHLYVAFRVSENGLLPAEHLEGRMVTLELVPTNLPQKEETPQEQPKKNKVPKGYRLVEKTDFVPAECLLRLRDGALAILQANVTVPQLGYKRTEEVLEAIVQQ